MHCAPPLYIWRCAVYDCKNDWDFYQSQGISPFDDWASIICVQVYPNGTFQKNVQIDEGVLRGLLLGYVFVIEPERNDAKYKMPGGHKQKGENPLETARREMKGETGLLAPDDAICYVNSVWRERPAEHWSVLCLARIEEREVPWMNGNDVENEGEVPKFLTVRAFREMLANQGFLRMHYQRLAEAGLISVK